MPRSLEQRLAGKQAAREFVDAVNARTVCRGCGAQPVEWHNPEHIARPNRRIGALVAQGYPLATIEAELAVCVPFCRSCHMKEDGRLAAFVAAVPRETAPPKLCQACARPYRPLRKGLCSRCYDRQRRAARGGGIANEAKTHCPEGHPYDEANTYTNGGKRYCRLCNATGAKQRRQRKEV